MKRRDDTDIDLVRRRIVQAVVAAPAFAFIGCGGAASADGGTTNPLAPGTLSPTPACDDGDDDPTPAQTEGPYFKSSSPQRASLIETGVTGTLLTVSGRVLSTACQPIAAAKLDFWQPTIPETTTMWASGCEGINSPTTTAGSRC